MNKIIRKALKYYRATSISGYRFINSLGLPEATKSSAKSFWKVYLAKVVFDRSFAVLSFLLLAMFPILQLCQISRQNELIELQHEYNTHRNWIDAGARNSSVLQNKANPVQDRQLAFRNLIWDDFTRDFNDIDIDGLVVVSSEERISFSKSELRNVRIYGRGARSFDGGTLLDSRISYTDLQYLELSETDASGLILENATIGRFYIWRSKLDNLHVSNSDICSMSLSTERLSGANFENSKLGVCGFKQHGFRKFNRNQPFVSFSNVHFEEVYFRNVKIYNADLSRSTGLSQESFTGVCVDENTALPDGIQLERCQ